MTKDILEDLKGDNKLTNHVIDYYIDSIRNYFLDNEEIKMPELRIENYEY